MNQANIITNILKDSKHHLDLFSDKEIATLREKIFSKTRQDKDIPYVKCIIREKDIQLKPEEIVRQLYLQRLIDEYNYPLDLIKVEYPVPFGSDTKRADIVILNKADNFSPFCVVELKKQTSKDGRGQLKSYTNATGAPLAVWSNGIEIAYYERLDPNYFEPLPNIPKFEETIDDVKNETFTYLELIQRDKLAKENKSLKSLIEDMEDEVLANAGVDVFEEVFKLIFIKLYDEMESAEDRIIIEADIAAKRGVKSNLSDDKIISDLVDQNTYNPKKFRQLEFRSRGDAYETRKVITTLFKKAKQKWHGIFEQGEPLRITDENHLQICIGFLQPYKLFNSNLQIIDEAFEYLVNKSAKGEKGQYFTPRNVIDMCVYMLNPQPEEYMIDTACGSCGFTMHTLFNVWTKLQQQGKAHFHNFSNQKLTAEQKEYVDKVFGIDFDEKSVRVARTINMIAGDGKTNVLHLNSLDYSRWSEKIKDDTWSRTYLEGYYRLLDLANNRKNPKTFNFDMVMANPPFAGDIKDSSLIANYDIAHKNDKPMSNISRDILFIERNLNFLKDGGRLAIVLPQGRFNNTSDQRIRAFIMERARLIAVVGLDGNTFKPHTGTKTSVLFVQKWHDELCPKLDDYPIFMAVSEQSGKDNSGEEIYETDGDGERVLDAHNHLMQKHDLKTIANAFEKWARKENLSFWSRYR